MTLQQLQYIITTAKCGSINEASKKLFISQPSLSKAIKEVETEFDITIFERTSRGIQLSIQGLEFLSYANQINEQVELLENHYNQKHLTPQHLSISTQHYAFAVNAFVNLIDKYGQLEYEFALKETKTYEIFDDVGNLRSEVGIIYINDFNSKVVKKLLNEYHLKFTTLFIANPHVFISRKNPLSSYESINLSDLVDYPYLSFEQGEYNSFYFSEEILSTINRKKVITVTDRATLFNLLIGLNGYTISTGVISSDLNGSDIIAVPLNVDDIIEVGYITHKNVNLSKLAQSYIDELVKITN